MTRHTDPPFMEPGKPGCTDPTLGQRASLALGRSLAHDRALREHIEHCLACQLERRAYDSLDPHRVEPSPGLAERIAETVRRAARTPGPGGRPTGD